MSQQDTLSWKGWSNLPNWFWESVVLSRVLFQYFLLWESLCVHISFLGNMGLLISTSRNFCETSINQRCTEIVFLFSVVRYISHLASASSVSLHFLMFLSHCVHSYPIFPLAVHLVRDDLATFFSHSKYPTRSNSLFCKKSLGLIPLYPDN